MRRWCTTLVQARQQLTWRQRPSWARLRWPQLPAELRQLRPRLPLERRRAWPRCRRHRWAQRPPHPPRAPTITSSSKPRRPLATVTRHARSARLSTAVHCHYSLFSDYAPNHRSIIVPVFAVPYPRWLELMNMQAFCEPVTVSIDRSIIAATVTHEVFQDAA